MTSRRRRTVLAFLLTAALAGAAGAREGTTAGDEAAGPPVYRLDWRSIDSGGAVVAGGARRLRTSVAQVDAVEQAGGGYTLRGGFLAATPLAGVLFGDGFESGDVAAWSFAVGAAP